MESRGSVYSVAYSQGMETRRWIKEQWCGVVCTATAKKKKNVLGF